MLNGPGTILPGGGGVLRFPEGHDLYFFPPGEPPVIPTDQNVLREIRMVAFQVKKLFQFADSHLSDAAMALWFFHKADSEVWPLPPENTFENRFDWLRARHSRGGLVDQIRRMHARSFVSSLEITLKILAQIRSEAGDHSLAGVVKQQEDLAGLKIPHLRSLRDSIQHADERILLQYRKPGMKQPQQISPEALDTPEYKGPQMHIGTLTGDLFRFTAWNGTQAEISIGDATFRVVRECVQSIVEDAPWYRAPAPQDMWGPNPPSFREVIPLKPR